MINTETLFYIKNRNQTTTVAIVWMILKVDYFTSKIEIKPQQVTVVRQLFKIILHQK